MNRQFKNSIIIEGYLYDIDFDERKIIIQSNDDLIEFRFSNDFKSKWLKKIKINKAIRVKGSFDEDSNGLFLLAEKVLVLPNFKGGE